MYTSFNFENHLRLINSFLYKIENLPKLSKKEISDNFKKLK